MAAQNKIEKYGLAERILALAAQPDATTLKIAEVVTGELRARGVADSISQPTVSRFLKAVRQERGEQTRQIVHDHIKATVPADLAALDEIEAWLLEVFRDHRRSLARIRQEFVAALASKKRWGAAEVVDLFTRVVGEATEQAGYDLKTRAGAAMNAVRVVETKLRFSGVLEGAAVGDPAKQHPVDLDDFRTEVEELRAEVAGRGGGDG